MRLRVKGESQKENVMNLINTLPTITFDRGYGKLFFFKIQPVVNIEF